MSTKREVARAVHGAHNGLDIAFEWLAQLHQSTLPAEDAQAVDVASELTRQAIQALHPVVAKHRGRKP